jgi:anhydro-N-acetylmuramic acid kinase
MRVMGLMSGTSVDGIDVACVTIEGQDLDIRVTLEAGITVPYEPELRSHILAVCGGEPLTVAQLTTLDDAIATAFAGAAQHLQASTGPVDLIGSHGQTVFHRPPQGDHLGYSVQLGRGEVIAQLTQTPTVSNFRAADLAAGGQGAPLVSRLDVALLSHPTEHRCVQNLGGIGNVTYLPPRQSPDWQRQILGWDTGPGNVLIDLAIAQLTHYQQTYDLGGQWAAQGQPCADLIDTWLQHPFFHQPPPKSTGRELFSPDYLQHCWEQAQAHGLSDADWLATLTDFTARTVALSYRTFLPHSPDRILLCGGGSRNHYLRDRLAHHLAPAMVETTDQHGVDSGSKEAIAFAVLAYWRWQDGSPGNVPAVTGAKQACTLGEIHPVIRQS